MKPLVINFENTGTTFYEDGTYTSTYWGSICSYWKIENGTMYFKHPHMTNFKEVKNKRIGPVLIGAIAEREIFGD